MSDLARIMFRQIVWNDAAFDAGLCQRGIYGHFGVSVLISVYLCEISQSIGLKLITERLSQLVILCPMGPVPDDLGPVFLHPRNRIDNRKEAQ